jgi:hypothetical protein
MKSSGPFKQQLRSIITNKVCPGGRGSQNAVLPENLEQYLLYWRPALLIHGAAEKLIIIALSQLISLRS